MLPQARVISRPRINFFPTQICSLLMRLLRHGNGDGFRAVVVEFLADDQRVSMSGLQGRKLLVDVLNYRDATSTASSSKICEILFVSLGQEHHTRKVPSPLRKMASTVISRPSDFIRTMLPTLI
jgi:hypothetical protein